MAVGHQTRPDAVTTPLAAVGSSSIKAAVGSSYTDYWASAAGHAAVGSYTWAMGQQSWPRLAKPAQRSKAAQWPLHSYAVLA